MPKATYCLRWLKFKYNSLSSAFYSQTFIKPHLPLMSWKKLALDQSVPLTEQISELLRAEGRTLDSQCHHIAFLQRMKRQTGTQTSAGDAREKDIETYAVSWQTFCKKTIPFPTSFV